MADMNKPNTGPNMGGGPGGGNMGSGPGGNAGTTALKDKAQNLREDLGSASQQIRERMSDVGQDVRELAATAGQMARQQLDPVEDYIRQYPLRAMLIAAGCGLVLGALVKR